MQIKTAKPFEGNQERAARMMLRPAPTLHGNFFTRQACLDNLAENVKLTGEGKPPRFLQMWLETKDECNLKCPMCFTAANGAGGRAKNEFLEWERAIPSAGTCASTTARRLRQFLHWWNRLQKKKLPPSVLP